jgi:two-component system phosphate regulon response regulator PhoB
MFTVLVVDDEPAFRYISVVILQRAGYQTLEASDAVNALKVIEAQSPDLIILDDMMPGMNGGDLCVRLKQDVRYSHIPIVMHTANPKFKDPAVVERIGADGLLLKPSLSHDIVAIVGRYVQAQI